MKKYQFMDYKDSEYTVEILDHESVDVQAEENVQNNQVKESPLAWFLFPAMHFFGR